MKSFQYLNNFQGFIETGLKVSIKDSCSLSLVYTPGVGKSCLEIRDDVQKSFELTNRGNSIALIAVGDNSIIPILENRAALYKELVNIDTYPILLGEVQDIKVAKIIENLTPNFSGFDISCIDVQRSNNIVESLSEDFNYPILTLNIDNAVSNLIKNSGLTNVIDPQIVSIYLFRAAIDTLATGFPDNIDEILSSAISNFENLNIPIIDQQKLALGLVSETVKQIQEFRLARNQITPEIAEKGLLNFFTNREILTENSHQVALDSDINTKSLEIHKKFRGIIEIKPKLKLSGFNDFGAGLSRQLADEIVNNPEKAYDLTAKRNLVAIISDGSAVLGFGNIGPEAGLPVMEGKAALFKTLAGVDAVPLCLKTQDTEELIEIISSLSPVFGGINLEDITAPKCFEIEKKLVEKLDIPVFHDDQHGTAVVALAGFINAIKLTGKDINEIKVVVNGAGAGAMSVSELLLSTGVKNLILCDTKGAIYDGRVEGMNHYKEEIAKKTNLSKIKGDLKAVIEGADFFFGLSAANVVTSDMVKSMNTNPVIFALANPVPEIMPDIAKEAGAFIVATGRSDFKNQVNNCLAFPGIFRGTLDVRAKRITNQMKISAANAIADLITDSELKPDYIIPHALDYRVSSEVAWAVARTAIETGVARRNVDPLLIKRRTQSYIYEGVLSTL